jgi:tRNA-2-methylthio-N6-dimethylallyladenosine synthase
MVTRTYEVRTHGCQMNVHEFERIAGLLDGTNPTAMQGQATDEEPSNPLTQNDLR